MSARSLGLALATAALASACGGGGSTPDAKPAIDAKASSVHIVSCTGANIKATIGVNASGTAFTPSTATINVNEVVEFTGGSFHPVSSGSGGAFDGNFKLDSGAGCAQFTAAGTFPFFCSVHLFIGSITVQ